MDTKKFKKACEELFGYFDCPNNCLDVRNSFVTVLDESLEEEWNRIEDAVEKAGIGNDTIHHYTLGNQMAFALGYVVGRLVDPGEKRILETEKVIEKVIREKELLLYLPREKKAA